jgi:predicted nucleic acid-binding protein
LGALTEALRDHAIVGLDTSVFIYQLEDSERYASVAEEALDAVAHGLFDGVTSVLTLMEVSVRPVQLGRDDVADDYERRISSYPNLRVIDIDPAIARRAAGLRATYRLKPADALQVAACIEHGATAFITTARRSVEWSALPW